MKLYIGSDSILQVGQEVVTGTFDRNNTIPHFLALQLNEMRPKGVLPVHSLIEVYGMPYKTPMKHIYQVEVPNNNIRLIDTRVVKELRELFDDMVVSDGTVGVLDDGILEKFWAPVAMDDGPINNADYWVVSDGPVTVLAHVKTYEENEYRFREGDGVFIQEDSGMTPRYGSGNDLIVPLKFTIPKEERCIGQVLIDHQLMELWERPIPHNYGVWNNKNPYIWLKYQRDPTQMYAKIKDRLEEAMDFLNKDHGDTDGVDKAITAALSLVAEKIYAGRESDATIAELAKEDPSTLDAPNDWVPWIDGHPQRGLWGFSVTPNRHLKYKWDETRVRETCLLTITCNDRVVYNDPCYQDPAQAAIEAATLIRKMSGEDSWFDFVNPESNVGRKIFYKNQPAIIERVILDQCCVMIKKDDGTDFAMSDPWDSDLDDDRASVKDLILSSNIYPYRN